MLFVGGGSIGHIAPSVAVWRAVRDAAPGAECHFVCSERTEEADFLKREKLPFTQLPFRRIRLLRPQDAPTSLLRARRILTHWKPDVIFCTGGALCLPVALAATMKKIPLVIHNLDSVSGRANAMMSRWASAVCHGFPIEETRDKRKKKSAGKKLFSFHRSLFTPRAVYTGNPIRPEVTYGSKGEGFRMTGLPGRKPVMIVTGGSQGSVALNEAVQRHLKDLLQSVEIVHLTGKGKKGAGKHPGYFSMEFAQKELPHLYALADMALSRSGAGNIGELAACGIPAILVPLRGVGHDHQYGNARVAERSGGCLLLDQESMDDDLVETVKTLAADHARLAAMGAAMTTLYVPDAANRIADILMRSISR